MCTCASIISYIERALFRTVPYRYGIDKLRFRTVRYRTAPYFRIRYKKMVLYVPCCTVQVQKDKDQVQYLTAPVPVRYRYSTVINTVVNYSNQYRYCQVRVRYSTSVPYRDVLLYDKMLPYVPYCTVPVQYGKD